MFIFCLLTVVCFYVERLKQLDCILVAFVHEIGKYWLIFSVLGQNLLGQNVTGTKCHIQDVTGIKCNPKPDPNPNP